jgi:hypothetical protein
VAGSPHFHSQLELTEQALGEGARDAGKPDGPVGHRRGPSRPPARPTPDPTGIRRPIVADACAGAGMDLEEYVAVWLSEHAPDSSQVSKASRRDELTWAELRTDSWTSVSRMGGHARCIT